MERRFLSIASAVGLEQRVGTDPPYIVGLASVFYNSQDPGTEYEIWSYDDERCVERIMPQAFDQVLAPQVADGFDTCALFNHDPNQLLGRASAGTLQLSKDSQGLKYCITPPDAPLAQGVIASIRRGDLRGSSFSFTCKQDGQRFIRQGKQCIREIHQVDKLYDVGPVTFPAYASATTGTRDRLHPDEGRAAFEAWLRAEAPGLATAIAVRARCAQLGL